VDISTDSDAGRPSSLEGKRTFRFSSLKRAADDDDAGPSGITSENINRSENNQQQIQGIVTHNRFACLSQDENITDDCMDTQQNDQEILQSQLHDTRRKRFAREPDADKGKNEHTHDTTQQTNVREKKPPPIYLTSKVKNYVSFTNALKESVGDNFQLKYLGENIKIQFYKTKDFIDFKKYAIEMYYTFHTYSLPNEKTMIVTLKGLPNIPDLSIQQELQQHGIDINSCIKINAENSLYATYKINLSAEYTLAQLRKIRFLYYSKIYWEKFINTKRILQCYRCQAFGHTSANCFKKPRCVKCAQSHITSECAKTPDTPAKCCNCSGEHPASFTQCPAYLKYLEKRTQITARENSNVINIANQKHKKHCNLEG